MLRCSFGASFLIHSSAEARKAAKNRAGGPGPSCVYRGGVSFIPARSTWHVLHAMTSRRYEHVGARCVLLRMLVCWISGETAGLL